VPGTRQLLSEHFNDRHDDNVLVIFPDISGSELRRVVSEIYGALVGDIALDPAMQKSWSDFFCCPGVDFMKCHFFAETFPTQYFFIE
jgi:hypothetical protein